jgi:hypothetical protein
VLLAYSLQYVVRAMNDKSLLQKIRRIVLENADGEVVSLYVIGSFLFKEMIESSLQEV